MNEIDYKKIVGNILPGEGFANNYLSKVHKDRKVLSLQDYEKGKFGCPKCGHDTNELNDFYNTDNDLECPGCGRLIGKIIKNR